MFEEEDFPETGKDILDVVDLLLEVIDDDEYVDELDDYAPLDFNED